MSVNEARVAARRHRTPSTASSRSAISSSSGAVSETMSAAISSSPRASMIVGVRGVCEALGLDPLYVACEGRMVAFVDPSQAEAALRALRAHPLGKEAAVIGVVRADPAGLVLLKTQFGGSRIVDMLVGDPLPRIC